MTHRIRLILGDQLNSNHSWFQKVDNATVYLMMEVRQETDYVVHHVQKVVGFFGAMRFFAAWLQDHGHSVHYIKLDDPENLQNIVLNTQSTLRKYKAVHLDYMEPDEYRLQTLFEQEFKWDGIEVQRHSTEHFLAGHEDLETHFKDKKQFRMEFFYRYMRKKYNILMNGKEPMGGQWNFDTENRKALPSKVYPPPPFLFKYNTTSLVNMVQSSGVKTIGTVNAEAFEWPLQRKDGLLLLSYFVENLLPAFGTYQDAMTQKSWSLFHSRLSFALNTKMLHPKEVIEAVVNAWDKSSSEIPLHQVEGFIRQILGWREYVRGVYKTMMPAYAQMNFFNHKRTLPSWFWTGNTKMKCLQHAIGQSLEKAYAHHIQRLMVTGNFALLAGIDPDEVDRWYLGIYIDAIEWVEMPNTRGMSQFADGGCMGSKPYVSSAAYIDRMSDYCKNCVYDAKKKTGVGACPFNSLYWHFYHRHTALLRSNPRIGMAYVTWSKMAETSKNELLAQAEAYLENIESL